MTSILSYLLYLSGYSLLGWALLPLITPYLSSLFHQTLFCGGGSCAMISSTAMPELLSSSLVGMFWALAFADPHHLFISCLL
jgi:hypothetical protein